MKKPRVGSVVRYSYLWVHEAVARQPEGLKDRPCAVVVAQGDLLLVVPITHAPPAPDDLAVELPRPTKQRLGLDDQRSWIITREYNRFEWPGPDIRPGGDGEAALGELPRSLIDRVIENVRDNARAGRLMAANRR